MLEAKTLSAKKESMMKTTVKRRLLSVGFSLVIAGTLTTLSSPAFAATPSNVPVPAPAGTLTAPKGSSETLTGPTTSPNANTKNIALLPNADGECTSTTTYAVTGDDGATTVNIPTTIGGDRNCSMVSGNTGAGVSRLQSNMHSGCVLGDTALAVDGDFGAATKAALELAQSTYGITADGQYGTNTANKMWWPAADGVTCIFMGA